MRAAAQATMTQATTAKATTAKASASSTARLTVEATPQGPAQ